MPHFTPGSSLNTPLGRQGMSELQVNMPFRTLQQAGYTVYKDRDVKMAGVAMDPLKWPFRNQPENFAAVLRQ